MINVLLTVFAIIFTGCAKKDHTHPKVDITPLQNQVNTLDSKQKQLEALLKALQLRVDALELIAVTHTNLLNSLQYQIDSGQLEVTNISSSLAFLESRLQVLEADLESIQLSETSSLVDIQNVTNNVTLLTTEIISLNAAIKQNDLFRPIPGCTHSYFALYEPGGAINQFWLTEDDGSVAGAWILTHNQTYNLLINNVQVCSGVRFDKNAKKLYYNNGSNQIIDLAY